MQYSQNQPPKVHRDNYTSSNVFSWLLPILILSPLIMGLALFINKNYLLLSDTLNITLTSISFALLLALITGLSAIRIYQAEKKLSIREKISKLLIENRKDYAIFMLDAKGNIASWNTGAEHLTGYKAEDILGKSFDCLYPIEDKQKKKPIELLQLALLNQQAEYEGWRIHKNGTRFWANITITALHDENNHLLGFSKLIRNATLRKDAEIKFHLLLEAAPDAMMIINKEGKITLANIHTEKIFGYSLSELYKQTIEKILPHFLHKGYLSQIIEKKSPQIGLEFQASHQKNYTFPIEISLSPLETSEGILAIATIRDITSRKQSEKKLETLIDNLKHSNQELERFAYIASHDLQEPLRMVSSYTQLLSQKYKDKLDQDANDFITFAVDGAKRMQQLITDLLIYSQISTKGNPFSETDCNLIIKDVILNLSIAIRESHAEITFDTLPTVKCDKVQILQLFQNLLSNSLKFHRNKPPRIHISAHQKDNEWVFVITDNGIGISPEYHDQIFLIFQRLHSKSEYPGTGVGLAICKKIIDRHHGKIWIESKLGEGTTFYFTLPA